MKLASRHRQGHGFRDFHGLKVSLGEPLHSEPGGDPPLPGPVFVEPGPESFVTSRSPARTHRQALDGGCWKFHLERGPLLL